MNPFEANLLIILVFDLIARANEDVKASSFSS